MVEFLSDAWLDAVAAAAATVRPPDGAEPAEDSAGPLTVRQIITDGPGGDVVYDLRLEAGTVTVDRTATATPDVTFQQDHETAARLVRGETHPHLALTGGTLAISGAAHRLTGWRATLGALDLSLIHI